MKLININSNSISKTILIILSIALIITLTTSSNRHFPGVNPHLANLAPNYVDFARLSYCPRSTIQDMSCSFCNHDLFNDYQMFFLHTVELFPGSDLQFIINYSDIKREIIVTFSGPRSEMGDFFTSIYTQGFNHINELGGMNIESEYWRIYNTHLRSVLTEKISQIKASNRVDYKFIFVGHSFGGSVALLAAYDLLHGKVLKRNVALDSPLAITYGQLRIGDSQFVELVNKSFRVIKIMRHNDFVARMPNCAFVNGQYRCYNSANLAMNHVPGLQNYFNGYSHNPAMMNNGVGVGLNGGVVPPVNGGVNPNIAPIDPNTLNSRTLSSPQAPIVEAQALGEPGNVPQAIGSHNLHNNNMAYNNPLGATAPLMRFKSKNKKNKNKSKKSRNNKHKKHIFRGTTYVDGQLLNTHPAVEPIPAVNPMNPMNPLNPVNPLLHGRGGPGLHNPYGLAPGLSRGLPPTPQELARPVTFKTPMIGPVHRGIGPGLHNGLGMGLRNGPYGGLNPGLGLNNGIAGPAIGGLNRGIGGPGLNTFYSQPFGMQYFSTARRGDHFTICNYINGIPQCERSINLPHTFTPLTHQYYYHHNMEMCR